MLHRAKIRYDICFDHDDAVGPFRDRVAHAFDVMRRGTLDGSLSDDNKGAIIVDEISVAWSAEIFALGGME